MGEKIAFVLPDTMEEALWAIPCISQHLLNRLVTKREVEKVYVYCPLIQIQYLVEACWIGVETWGIPFSEKIRNEVDVMFEFNPERSYALTKAVGKHIIEAYGVLLGTVSLSMLPPIVSTVKEKRGNVLVVGRYWLDEKRDGDVWPHLDSFVEMGKAFGIETIRQNMNVNFSDLMDAVAEASVVVGVRGTATLLASCFGKIVMELSPESWGHKNWMSKWENKKYRMVYANLNDISAVFAWERTRILVEEMGKREANRWERRGFIQSPAEESIQTAQ